MRKRIKNFIIVWFLISAVMLFSSCGRTGSADKKQSTETEKSLEEIMTDLNSDKTGFLETFDGGYQVTNLELIKRNTQANVDEVYCTIAVEDGIVSISQDYAFLRYYKT